MNKILVLLVFSHQQGPCTWSLPCLMRRTHFKQSVGKFDSLIYISESSKPVKPKSKLEIKIGLAEECDITIRGVITRTLVFRTNRGTRLINFTRRNPVWRTYNTEPSPKELAWGRSTFVYPGKYSYLDKYSFPF